MKYYVQRSTDGQIIYIRKAPNTRWEARIPHLDGADYVFEDLSPGQGRYYNFTPSTRVLRKEIGMRRGFTLTELIIGLTVVLLTLVFLMPVLTMGGCVAHYSDGDRVGVVTKLSQKGFLFKSWEGEMNLGSTASRDDGTVVPTVWRFSFDDEEQVRALMKLGIGRRVRLHYHQYLEKPMRLETDYVIDGVGVIPERSP